VDIEAPIFLFLSVHALKLRFEVYSLRWLGTDWMYSKRSRSYQRRFNLSHPVSVQCFDTGTVLVSVKASVRPFRLDFDGLLSLASLLGELRACLRALVFLSLQSGLSFSGI